MKLTVRLFAFWLFALAVADANDPAQIEKHNKIKTYQLDVPGKEPITIVENEDTERNWKQIMDVKDEKDNLEMKNLMTHIVHDLDGNKPRCYGPSCQEGQGDDDENFDDYILTSDKLKDFGDFPKDRLQAISALAAKLKKEKYKLDRYPQPDSEEDEDNNGKVYTTWNRLKVKQHKHPYDDKDGWVTLEPVAWSSSKISKWKPNVKKQKPSYWNEDENKFPDDDRYMSNVGSSISSSSSSSGGYNYPQKRPSLSRPGFINNKLHVPHEYEQELPSRPTWSKPQQASYPPLWAQDDSRRPHKPNCDNDDGYPNEDTVYYGMSDSVMTDNRPSNFPYEYEALHPSSSSKRPFRRPTQVVYSGPSDYDNDRASRPPYGDGQWVLLSTTKGYRNKKRQRSLSSPADEPTDASTVTSHQAIALTVLPVDNIHTNMTTSHGGLLEVEKSFQTVEESKRDLDKKNDLDVSASQIRPVKSKVVRRVMSNVSPDSSTLLAAVGAGMVPATMAMVVPMMLGRRRRDIQEPEDAHIQNILYRYQ
ncbi:hypothetical protein O3G_MSEX001591 [Manduca sexta]|uniref:Uncharacterized protein n=1 Tax=Manduca sexta TaxID=7130 RepID=A0A921YKP8_MANSE|nr:hypothetical protein O3G_MSEX001591 [Manduca sexta]